MFKRLGIRKLAYLPVVLAIAGALACGGEEEAEDTAQSQRGGRPGMGAMARTGASIPVEVKTVGRGNIAATLLTYTSLEAERHVDVVSRTQGLVKSILVEEGDRVTEGQPLAQLDTDALELTLREREVNMNSLESNYKRSQELVEQELLSSQEFEQTKFQYEAAATQYESAKLQLEYATVRSPFSGIVTERLVEVGNLVNANDVVFRTADLDPLLARIHVPEKDIGQVRPGQSVRINVEGSDQTHTGRVALISPIVDPESGTVKVTVEIRDRMGTLRPGMFTTVNLVIAIQENVLQVEKKALVAEAEGSYAFLFQDGTAEKRLLEIGIAEGDYVEVLSGLSDGDSIITVGQEGLRNGAPVRIAGQIPPAAEGMGGGPAGMGGSAGEASQAPAARPASAGEGTGGSGGSGRPGMAGENQDSGRPGGTGGGRMMAMDLDQMKERMFQNPDIKAAYDKQVEEDPSFAEDEERQRTFLIQQMRQMRAQRGGGRQQ
ncbi:MAG: efflux RND transporter periplasmic adaptor subunit [Gemmatimonadetes bacterium]|nr:efflux RND transporter periplasmic adaptor subunit [Gemmatimonadota bacterium]MYB60438.1 efflux RND transporter periplasmic adaptor subunit [Gemmatimonadota bacterium]